MSEIQALWWMMQYVVLPAIAGAYALITAFGWKMLRVCSGGRRDLWLAVNNIRTNEVKHLQKQIDELKSTRASPSSEE